MIPLVRLPERTLEGIWGKIRCAPSDFSSSSLILKDFLVLNFFEKMNSAESSEKFCFVLTCSNESCRSVLLRAAWKADANCAFETPLLFFAVSVLILWFNARNFFQERVNWRETPFMMKRILKKRGPPFLIIFQANYSRDPTADEAVCVRVWNHSLAFHHQTLKLVAIAMHRGCGSQSRLTWSTSNCRRNQRPRVTSSGVIDAAQE